MRLERGNFLRVPSIAAGNEAIGNKCTFEMRTTVRYQRQHLAMLARFAGATNFRYIIRVAVIDRLNKSVTFNVRQEVIGRKYALKM
jgi:hypothetical protein